ncbi:hypothetical protein [uncultured Kordia sp.]|uniref:hypothetical protein n=1 Tax=uncultured Kordia sp. TaxID=507699 RepID=UPI0026349477|nr:hypothetical protein [uncultured Kordia sp.]
MKKLQFIVLAIIATTFFISCQDSKHISNADDLGKYAFDILKKFENSSKEDYVNSLLTLEEFKSFAKKNGDSMQQVVKESIEKLDKKTYESGLLRQYTLLKDKAKELNISWNAIEYGDFTYEERTDDGMTGIRGQLTFTHNGTQYEVSTSALLTDNVYVPVIINQLNEKN